MKRQFEKIIQDVRGRLEQGRGGSLPSHFVADGTFTNLLGIFSPGMMRKAEGDTPFFLRPFSRPERLVIRDGSVYFCRSGLPPRIMQC
jgi:hypothetical protein